MSAPPPPPGSLGEYNEDEIVGLMTNIYKILIRQGHFEEDQVFWAPPEGHPLDISLLEDPDSIDDRVYSLMKKLPSANACIVPFMKPVNYYNAEALGRSRDIDRVPKPEYPGLGRADQTNALPTVLLLLEGWESTDPALVLDIASNTVRFFDKMYSGLHYMDFPAEHAPTYLRRVWDNYCTAMWVTDFEGGIHETHSSGFRLGPELQRTLLDDYHWPGPDFRQADWKRDGPKIVDRLFWAPDPTHQHSSPLNPILVRHADEI